VDTHVWQIAVRDYKFRLKGKKVASLTKDVYNSVGEFFRRLWGDHAGWAHSVVLNVILLMIGFIRGGFKCVSRLCKDITS
jgi:N-glycosylase/DNA lyase